MTPLVYPEARRDPIVEVLHGTPVPDPWRWLEDPDAPETRAWVAAQNALVREALDAAPLRAEVRDRLEQLWDFARVGVPQRRGGRVFQTRNDGLQEQDVLTWREEGEAAPRALIDPNRIAGDGATALTGWEPSERGRYLAYGLSVGGSDWQEWRVREVATGRDLPEVLRRIKFTSVAWTPDEAGFFYSRYPEPAPGAPAEQALFHQTLWYHRLGTPQDQDRLVVARPDDKHWGFSPHVSEDGRWLVVTVWRGTDPRTGLLVGDLARPEQPLRELTLEFDANYEWVGSAGEALWFKTDLGAPRGRLVEVDLRRPGPPAWRELIPEGEDALREVHALAGGFLAVTLHHAHTRLRRHARDGAPLGEVALPGIGTASGFPGRQDDPRTWCSFTSFASPPALWRLDLVARTCEQEEAPALRFEPGDYVTRQEFVVSPDGTRVPLFLTARRDLPAGPRPTYLYGYGGFNVPLTPAFSPALLAWMERGGVYAVACLRGGGEYGEEWHQAGTRERKQNVFDDFAACAEHLVASGVTSPAQLAIGGGSNGGLLVGATITQRPELCAAGLAAVGVHDMLRFHKFTIGWAWVPDYGDPDDPDDFQVLHAYSPLHRVRPGTRYPAVLLTAAEGDDRVVPAHTYKFAAALQAAQAAPAPILCRVDPKAGHGLGKSTRRLIEEAADRWAFLSLTVGWGSAPPG